MLVITLLACCAARGAAAAAGGARELPTGRRLQAPGVPTAWPTAYNPDRTPWPTEYDPNRTPWPTVYDPMRTPLWTRKWGFSESPSSSNESGS